MLTVSDWRGLYGLRALRVWGDSNATGAWPASVGGRCFGAETCSARRGKCRLFLKPAGGRVPVAPQRAPAAALLPAHSGVNSMATGMPSGQNACCQARFVGFDPDNGRHAAVVAYPRTSLRRYARKQGTRSGSKLAAVFAGTRASCIVAWACPWCRPQRHPQPTSRIAGRNSSASPWVAPEFPP